jgi:hypothetical protein
MSGKRILLRMEQRLSSGMNNNDVAEATHAPPPSADQDHPDDLEGAAAPHSRIKQIAALEKDDKIGMYSPEARKARIAKFHSKRKTRIWRKRIKYDVRKKLADSRPRIKGRFVKRSDKEDESHENGTIHESEFAEETHDETLI